MKHALMLYSIMGIFMLHAQRSVHRPRNPHLPFIEVWSTTNSTHYSLIDHNLRPVPLLRSFNKQHFEKNLVPTPGIEYDNHTKLFSSQTIDKLINTLLAEIAQHKKTYTDFTILKQSGFARYKECGLLVLKFKQYPFVLKLFMESPQSFVNPYDKGFEVACIFSSGGSLRHTLGFSRIQTLNYVDKKIAQDPYWRNRIIMPRKWFWLPHNPCWLHILTHHLGPHETEHLEMPSIYGVIADELIKDSTKKTQLNELMAFSKFLEHRIDPHTKNFFVEKNTSKIALIDTELFPLILGYSTHIKPHDTYMQWYTHLAGKFIHERLGLTKSARRTLQHSTTHYYLS